MREEELTEIKVLSLLGIRVEFIVVDHNLLLQRINSWDSDLRVEATALATTILLCDASLYSKP